MNLLAIPNDPLSAYRYIPRRDFLGEFNPLGFFDDVSCLNWKEEEDGEYEGVRSLSVVNDKRMLRQTLEEATKENRFSYPLFTPLFFREMDEIEKIASGVNGNLIRAFNTHFAAELGIILRDRLNIPLVVSAHDIERLTGAVKKADRLVCVSEALAQKCSIEYCIPSKEITLIPDGINMDLFYARSQAEISSRVGSYDGSHRLLSVGRMVPGKNLGALLGAVKIVDDELGGVSHIHLGAGSDENRARIGSLRDRLGLKGVSHFLGKKQRDELPSFYSWADVYVLPTLHEGLGRASIEALACGTPVVTTNYAPMTEVIQDEYNGLTADPRNPEDIAEKLIRILTDRKLGEELFQNARASVVDRYSLDSVMRKYVELYRSLK